MTEYKLHQKEKISARSSKELILLIAKYGNHYHEGPSNFRTTNFSFKTDADVKRAYAQAGYEFNNVIKLCRNYENPVPLFENQVGSTFKTIGSPKISTVDMVTGDENTILTSPGSYAIYEYWARFEKAAKSRIRAVRDTSFVESDSAILEGIASIEGYISYQVERWNHKNPHDQLTDSRENKVSFDNKIKQWIPKISGGKKLNKIGDEWEHFKILRRIRDEKVHPKNSSIAVSYEQLAAQINLFRTGIAGTLINLHILFNEKIPSIIIRTRYAPDVEVIQISD